MAAFGGTILILAVCFERAMSAEAAVGAAVEAILEEPPQVPDRLKMSNFSSFCEWLPGARLQLGQLDSDENYRAWIQQQTAGIEQEPGTMPLWQDTSKLDAAAGYRAVSLGALQERSRILLVDGAWSTKEAVAEDARGAT